MAQSSELDEMPPALRKALGGRRDADPAAQWAKVRDLAYQEWVAWLSGRRHDSLASLERERIIAIFELRREVPTVQRLVEEFGISEGRASSMMSRIRYAAGRRIRALQLEEVADHIGRSVGKKRGKDSVLVRLSRSRTRVFDAFLAEAVEDDDVAGPLMATDERSPAESRWTATADEWSAVADLLRSAAGEERRLAG